MSGIEYSPSFIIRCIECNRGEVGEKIIDRQFCGKCFGITTKEEAMSVRCIGSKIIEPEDIKPEKPKKNTPQLTARKNSVNVYNFNVFNVKNFRIKVSFFISLSLVLGIFIYCFFRFIK